MTGETNANNELTQFAYNAAGDLTTLTDGRGKKTYWAYDTYGRVTAKTNHLNTKILGYQYNANGWLSQRWSLAKGNTDYAYDALGSVTNVDYATSITLSYTYDKNRRLKTMNDAVGASAFAYTDWGGLASEDGPWADDKVSYGYNNGLLRSSMSLQQPNADAWVQTYAYEANLRLDSTTSPAGLFNYTPDTTKKRLYKSIDLPGGSQIERQFDSVGRVSLTRLKNSGGTALNSHAYLYDLAGQPARQTRAGGDYVDYEYDLTGQLLTALGKESGGVTNRLNERYGYAYDAGGNLLRRTNSVSATSPLIQTFGVDDQNQLTSITRSGTLTVAGTSSSAASSVTVNANSGGAVAATLYTGSTFARQGVTLLNGNNTFVATGTDSSGRQSTDSITVNLPSTVSFTYDNNGNLTSDGRRTFTYDDENQLLSVSVASAWKSEFLYDGLFRRRVRKEFTWTGSAWQQTNEVRYVYDGLVVLQERDILNQPQVTYTRGLDISGSRVGAGGIGGLLARTESSGSAYYHGDLGGNVTALVNGNQAVVARYLYDAYGNTLSLSGPLAEANLYRFSSKEVHPASGLSYYLYRYYDPNLQRWVNRDRLGEDGGINLFTFCLNNPVVFLDAHGKNSIGRAIGGIVGGLIGGGIGGIGGIVGGGLVGGTLGSVTGPGAPFTAGGGAVVGGIGGALLGSGIGSYYGGNWGDKLSDSLFGPADEHLPANVPTYLPNVPTNPDCSKPVESSGLPPGFWPGDRGAEEWGRRNGRDPTAARHDFHDIKQDDNMSGARDKYGVHPDTGDVVDPEGNIIGNLGD